MKTTLRLIFTAAILAALTGCTGLSKVVRELKDDPAAVRIRVTTIYGNIEVDRIGSPATGEALRQQQNAQ